MVISFKLQKYKINGYNFAIGCSFSFVGDAIQLNAWVF